MPPPRLVKVPTLPMTPISPNSHSDATPRSGSRQEQKSNSINRHADLVLMLIEEQRRIAVAEMREELERHKAALAGFQFNHAQVTNAYKAQAEAERRETQKYRDEVTALKKLLDYAQIQQDQLVAENGALKAKMESATNVVKLYLEERARIASTFNVPSPIHNHQLIPKVEAGSDAPDGSQPNSHRRDQFVQTETVPLPPPNTISSSHRITSSDQAQLRLRCDQLQAEKQHAVVEKMRAMISHKKEVDDLKQLLDNLQRKCESLSNSALRGSPTANQSNSIMAVKVEEAPVNMRLEKEKSLSEEVGRLKELVAQLEKDKLAASLEAQKESACFQEQIRVLKTDLEETKANVILRKAKRPPTNISMAPIELPDDDDDITVVGSKKRRITIDLT